MGKALSILVLLAALGACDSSADNSTTQPKENNMGKKIVQTAGRDQLGTFAPEFAHYNDDILFGENWNNTDIDLKTRSIVTIVSLMSMGITDSSLIYHLETAKKNGVSKEEIAAVITHAAFYAGWPKAWAVFNLAKGIWKDDAPVLTEKEKYQQTIMFPIGEPNEAYAQYFIGQSYLAPISTEQVKFSNVTFEPVCRYGICVKRPRC